MALMADSVTRETLAMADNKVYTAADPTEFIVACANDFPFCLYGPARGAGIACLQSECACEVARLAVAKMPNRPTVTIR